MHGLETIIWMNTGDNYKQVLTRRQLNFYPGKPSGNNGHNSDLKALLRVTNNQLLTVKEVLDDLLSANGSLPQEVRQSLEAARAMTWAAFQAEEKNH